MATISFEKDLIIDTEEAVDAMNRALDKAKKRGPMKLPDFSEELEGEEDFLKNGKI